MRHSHLSLVLFAALLASCCPTRIVTVSPNTYNPGMYSTIVSTPRTNTMVTTTRVIAANEDISLSLDLQAVAAAFAQSSTIEEFENLLNNGSYMLSNLDLNNDGYVDYLRVLETVDGNAHVFIIQSVLAPDIYQDVATVVAEIPVTGKCYVQVIGSEFLYGPRFIIEPVFIAAPPIFIHLRLVGYRPWRSPWYWGHFPPCYKHPAPLYLSHYQAYVSTYMRNHRYCHEFRYAPSCHFPEYERMARPYIRNDYGTMHPERSFATRTADIPVRSSIQASGRAVNARDIREEQDAIAVTNVTPSRTAIREAEGSASRSAAAASSSASRTATRNTGSETAAGTTSTSRSASTASSASRSATTGTSVSGTSRSSAARTSGSTTTRTGDSNTRRSSVSSGAATSGQTTVRSSVSNSGTANTRISTSPANGRSSATRSSSGASGSSSSSSTSRSAARSQTSGATRSNASGSSSVSSGSSSARSAGNGTATRSSGSTTTSRSTGSGSGSASRSSGTGSSSSSRGARR